MSREHEITHHLLTKWLGLDYSPTFSALARGEYEREEIWKAEEAAVLAIQRFANLVGQNLLAVAAGEGLEPSPPESKSGALTI